MRELLLLRAPADRVAGAAWAMAGGGLLVAPLLDEADGGAGTRWTVVVPDGAGSDGASPDGAGRGGVVSVGAGSGGPGRDRPGPDASVLRTAAALTVARTGPALALWWSEHAAGLTVVARGKARTIHVWGADADVASALDLDDVVVADPHAGGGSLSEALHGDAAVLAELFATPAAAPLLRAVLRRPSDGRGNVAQLLETLGAPVSVLDLALGPEQGRSSAADLPGAVHVPRASMVAALRRSATYVGPLAPRWIRWYDARQRSKSGGWRLFVLVGGLAQLALAVRVAPRWDDGGGMGWLLLAAVLGLTGLGNVTAGCTPARPAPACPVTPTGRNAP